MTTLTISYGFLDLQAEIEDTEKDCFDPYVGHYTVPDNVILVAVYHKGEDILDLLSDSVVNEIYDAYETQCNESKLP